ncbi:MAG: glycoside hydrolase family 43 protein [Planctomycetota bacterium]|nr:glycoside hydrolase family 43 protein [Planctomycetota bacterium]
MSEREGAPAGTYANPVGGSLRMGDPFVLQHGGRYYLYGTNASDGFRAWTSTDLVNWQELGYVFRRAEGSWAQANFWAPEVMHYRGRFYLAYSADDRSGKGFRLCLAVAERPEGPFRDLHAPWLDRGWSSIDAHLFIDDDGAPYVFFDKVGVNPGPPKELFGIIYGMRLTEDLAQPAGEPVLCVQADQPWEEPDPKHNSRCDEGALVFKHAGRYYMTFSGGHYASPRYAIGYATAGAPLGPWQKAADNPLLAADPAAGVSGPGHSSIARSPDGSELFLVYHAHADPARPGGNRTVNIDRLFFEAGGRLRAVGPTRTPQPLPSGVPL